MRKIVFIALLTTFSFSGMAQVTYMETNNFLLNSFTSTGYSHYDWRCEPLKNDYERGYLKGDISKIVTNITNKTGDGFSTHLTDTTYYNTQGNITKVVALKKDEMNPRNIFRPDLYLYKYNEQGRLTNWTWFTETESIDGKYMAKHVHDIVRDNRGNPTKEIYRAYSQKGTNWEEFTSGNNVAWTFEYDPNGNLKGGKGWLNMKLTYQNGQLTKMQEQGSAVPVTYTYNAAGRLTALKYYMIDGMDEPEYLEYQVSLTYNEKGDISRAVKTTAICNSKWVRQRLLSSVTYTITYTYDAKDNWTKAVVNSRQGKAKPQLAYSIIRAISYR